MMPFSECHRSLRPVVTCFYLALTATASAFFTNPALAQMRLNEDCVHSVGDPQSCTHVVGCIGGDTLFVGGSIGWDRGTIEGALYSGETCTGTWDNSTGMARFDCGAGLEGTVRYNVFDGETGTAIGQGEMLDGRRIDVWSGMNIREYVQGETGRVTLQCGVQEVPLS